MWQQIRCAEYDDDGARPPATAAASAPLSLAAKEMKTNRSASFLSVNKHTGGAS